MKFVSPLTLVRISFWIGAIVDAFVAVQMVFPDYWASFNHFASHQNSQELNAALGVGASLMIGWTALLLWADRKPVERRGVLLITIFPVVAGMVINNLLGIASGLRTWDGMALSLAFQAGISLLYVYSYYIAGKVQKSTG